MFNDKMFHDVCMRSIACLLVSAAPAWAGSLDGASPAGRYALSDAECKADDVFATLTAKTLTLPTYACKGVAYDQTESKGGRALYAVAAKSCGGEEGPSKPDKFKIVVEGDTLQFLWANGTKSAQLVRCAGAGRK
jgi:hypothetical protein